MSKTITIPASVNGVNGIYNENAGAATVFGCISATGAFTLRVGTQPHGIIIPGQVIGSPTGPLLGNLGFENSGASSVDVTFDVGNTPQIINPVQTLPTSTHPVTGGVGSLLAGANTELLPVATSPHHTGNYFTPPINLRRTKLRVFNPNATGTIDLQFWTGAPLNQYLSFETLGPGEKSDIYETDDVINVLNSSGGPLNYGFLNIFEVIT